MKESDEYQNYTKKLGELRAQRDKAADEATTAAATVKNARAHCEEVELDRLVERSSDSALANARQRVEEAENEEKLARARQRAAAQDLEKLDKALSRVMAPVYVEVVRNRMEAQLETAKKKLHALQQAKEADEELERCVYKRVGFSSAQRTR